jgi:hypothetical protein
MSGLHFKEKGFVGFEIRVGDRGQIGEFRKIIINIKVDISTPARNNKQGSEQ